MLSPAIQEQILTRFDVLLLKLDVSELNRKIRTLESASSPSLRRNTGFRRRTRRRKVRRNSI